MLTMAVLNQKGGVGKTSTVLGLASALSQDPGPGGKSPDQVLVVDADPQANATAALLPNGLDPEAFTLNDILEDTEDEGLAGQAIIKADWPGVNLIPAVLDLAARDGEAAALGFEFRLRRALTGLDGYPVVLVDCPPSLGKLVVNALVAADQALIVTTAAAPSLMGVANVMKTISVVRQFYNPGLVVAGIVVNLLPAKQRESEFRLAELLADDEFGSLVWEPYVPARAIVAEAQGQGQPIHDYARGRDITAVYDALAARVLGLKTV